MDRRTNARGTDAVRRLPLALRWRAVHARARREDGFTFVELVTALTILGVGMLLLTAALANNMKPLLLGKQRAGANAEAQRVLELVRGLSFDDVGLVAGDPTLPQNGGTDPEVVNAGGTWKHGAGCPSAQPCEAVAYAANASNHPLNPHFVTGVASGPFKMNRWVWVTQVSPQLRRATVRVRILNPGVSGVGRDVRVSTLVSSAGFSPTGVPLTGTAGAGGGARTLTMTVRPPAGPNPTAVMPSSAAPGASASVTVTGTGFEAGASVDFGPGISVAAVAVDSATRITANLQVSPGAAQTSRDVTVSGPGSSGTCAGCFTVVAAGSPAPSPRPCIGDGCTFTITVAEPCTGCGGTHEAAAVPPVNQVGCTARGATLDASANSGVTIGSASASTLADDDPLTAVTPSDSRTSTSPAATVPTELATTVSPNPVAMGSASCMSSVQGPNAVPGGDDDLSYSVGSASGPASLSLTRDARGAHPGFGSITLGALVDSSTSTPDARATIDGGPGGEVVVVSTMTLPESRFVVMNSVALGIAAPDGLLAVDALTLTATATGHPTAEPAAPSVGAATMRLRVFDPSLQLGATCASAVGQGVSSATRSGAYCVLQRPVANALTFRASLSLALPGAPTLRWTVDLSSPAPSTTSLAGTRGKTWTAEAAPLTGTVSMCATSAASCAAAGGKVLEAQASFDLGKVRAQAVRGLGS